MIAGLSRARMRFRLAALLLLAAVTVASFHAGFRYRVVDAAVAPPPAAGGWSAGGPGVRVSKSDPSIVVLSAGAGRGMPFLAWSADDPKRFDSVRVSAELSARRLGAGRARWRSGRILLGSFYADGRRMRHLPDEVGRVAGDAEWRRVALVIPVEAETARLRLVLYNGGHTGDMLVRALSVDNVAETPAFAALRIALIVLWAGVVPWVCWPLLARRRWRLLPAATVATGLAILAGTLTPQPYLSNALSPVLREVRLVLHPAVEAVRAMASGAAAGPAGPHRAGTEAADDDPASGWAPRLGAGWSTSGEHFLAFCLLGLVAASAFPGAPRLNLAAYLASFALAGEALQAFYVSRTVEPIDAAANIAGAALGLGTVWLVRRLRRKPRGDASAGVSW